MQARLIIPVKQLDNAKQRLSGVLSAAQRQKLCTAMLEDVLDVAATCDSIDAICVVTDDDEVRNIAAAYGAEVMAEPETPGLIPTVTHAAKELKKAGVGAMVFLPCDVPLVTVEELDVMLSGLDAATPAFRIAPASDLGGSNCVVCVPPDCITFGFGEDSFRRHLGFARERGIEPVVATLPGVGLDVDTPEDLRQLQERLADQPPGSRTHKFLVDLALSGEAQSEKVCI